MHLEYVPSERSTIGVEVEYGLVRTDTEELAPLAEEILNEIGQGHPDGEHPKAKHELFASSIEVITGICETPTEAADDLKSTLLELKPLLDARGVAMQSAGTHPFAGWDRMELSPGERYKHLVKSIGWPARRLAIHGVHVHVGVRSAEKSIMFLNSLSGFLPQMLALSCSSPYWLGDDTGLASIRTKIFEIMPTSGLPPWVYDWADFENFVAALVRAETIQTVKEVWWDVRPNPRFGTVEFRMCDGIPTLREVTGIAAMAQALVTWMDEQVDAGLGLPDLPSWVTRENKWRASRYGLDGAVLIDSQGKTQPMRENIKDILEFLMPVAERLGTAEELASVREIMEIGPSYKRQRQLVEQGGSLEDVVKMLREELAAELRS